MINSTATGSHKLGYSAPAGFFAGGIFGIGLWIGGMTEPLNVQGFLDVIGSWRPQLALVLGAAVLVSGLSYGIVARLRRPLLGGEFEIPESKTVDFPLIAGAVLFGAGWGLSGYCPGPALVALGQGSGDALVFCLAMIAGMYLYSWNLKRQRLLKPTM